MSNARRMEIFGVRNLLREKMKEVFIHEESKK